MFKLLSKPTTNYKANKNITIGYNTYFLSLAHSDISGYNVCPFANKLKAKENNKNKSFCSSVCVGYNGFAQIYKNVMKSRVKKTKLFFENQSLFMEYLIKDIEKAIKQSIKKGLIPTFRLNAYSDIKFENIKIIHNDKEYLNIFEIFPDVKFYDYTKIPNRVTPKNYELTYSFWGNKNHLNKEINTNKNVAIVFDKLPTKYKNKRVINGDKTDLRLKDNDGSNVVVGLKFKGSKQALKDGINEGFVIDTNN
tara:strand:+ start:24 stop:776 length:753 start_codon:yes stop_codon:yes gene_type:complete